MQQKPAGGSTHQAPMEDCASSDDDTGVGISQTLQSLSNTATSSTTSTTTADASNAFTLAALVEPE